MRGDRLPPRLAPGCAVAVGANAVASGRGEVVAACGGVRGVTPADGHGGRAAADGHGRAVAVADDAGRTGAGAGSGRVQSHWRRGTLPVVQAVAAAAEPSRVVPSPSGDAGWRFPGRRGRLRTRRRRPTRWRPPQWLHGALGEWQDSTRRCLLTLGGGTGDVAPAEAAGGASSLGGAAAGVPAPAPGEAVPVPIAPVKGAPSERVSMGGALPSGEEHGSVKVHRATRDTTPQDTIAYPPLALSDAY